jgi:hypothetical protein
MPIDPRLVPTPQDPTSRLMARLADQEARISALERTRGVSKAVAFRAVRSANVSLGVAAPQYVDMDTIQFNYGGAYGTNITFGSRRGFTAPMAGVYRFSWGITTQPLTGYGEPILRINGVDKSYAGTREAHNVSGGSWHFGTDLFSMVAADFAELVLQWDNGGGGVLLLANASYSFFNGELVGTTA